MWILDSWKAVAIAIVVARGGNPRRWEIAAISVVQRACSMSICARVLPTSATQYSLRTGSRSRTTVATSTAARTSPVSKAQRNFMVRGSIGVQVGVELDAASLAARSGLEHAGLGVGEEQDAVLARQLRRLDHRAVGHEHPAPGSDIGAGGHDAVVAERDADAGVGADQAVLADADDRRAAAGERAHDGRTTPHVGAVADRDAGGDAALDHGSAQRAGI